ncbi:VPLPA-CTERM protein sorting domain-containing protein [Duganella sp. CF402]|uniref:FxDxF family PEP-CTERM protein n=1 Tax=unclassified Duganella TaxID=2636909 RepID=UPI0008BCFD72|nr:MULTISPECIES: FxDxF family PEP-CTERM protein [unclassified Duganella]RZT10019.1 putative secreted protein [Duganella sp. BK701]SEL32424.1 VPLPA-CTERM protein sorting domain-containing protein [Duganella sp. CF402]
MKLRSLALGFILAASSCVASAAAFTVALTPTTPGHLTASFGDTPVLGSFTDVFTFTPTLTPGSSASAYFFNFSLDGNYNYDPNLLVTFSSANLNGTPFSINNSIPFTQAGAYVPSTGGPLVLTISGTSYGGSYAGVVNVTLAPVPEPATYGMLVAGLGLLGVVARRKRSA